jgi:hypothetical protein
MPNIHFIKMGSPMKKPVKNVCRPSPRSPAWSGLDWMYFSNNVDCGGFDNRDRTAMDYKWRDPFTGEVVCNP